MNNGDQREMERRLQSMRETPDSSGRINRVTCG
jgi:hypothetical protein